MRTIARIVSMAVAMALCAFPSPAADAPAAAPAVRAPEEILKGVTGVPSVEAVLELFINASEWDGPHQKVKDPSQEALVKIGHEALPPILKKYVSSTDVRRRITVDTIVKKVGFTAAPHLIPFLRSADVEERRHAAYLLGDAAFAMGKEDPSALGPFPEDAPARAALVKALATEEAEPVLRAILGALGKFLDPGLVKVVEPYLAHPAEPVRLNVAVTLGYVPHADAVKALIGALSDRMGSVRQAATLSLSGKAVGATGFDALVSKARSLPMGSREQLCCLDALARYLRKAQDEATAAARDRCTRAAGLAAELVQAAPGPGEFLVRGYAVALLEYAPDPEQARAWLAERARQETQPFASNRIDEARRALDGP